MVQKNVCNDISCGGQQGDPSIISTVGFVPFLEYSHIHGIPEVVWDFLIILDPQDEGMEL